MKPTPGVWGIDLGQCALKALRLQEIDGQLQATAFDYVEYPKILSQPDADPDQLTREALEKFLSQNSLKGDTVAIAVPGQSGLARFVKLPPVEEKKIADIVKFEAKQQIPFNLDEVVWDYQKLGAANVVDGFALETEIGLFAMKRDMVNKYLQHFKEVGVEVHIIQMAPLSLCNFVAYDLLNKDSSSPPPEGKQPAVVALDLGTDSSNLVVTDGGRIIWQRPIPLGGNHFTRALTKDMKLTFAKAEHLKRNATKSGAAELKKILASLKPVLTDFVGEVQRSLGYFTNTHRDAQIEYMVGLGNAFRLPGLQRFLSEKLSLDVRKLEKMSRIGGDVVVGSPIFNENIMSFGVAYGLCLQGLSQAKLVTNLLPGEIRLERLIRSKKPYAVAAAGLLVLGLGGIALGNHLNERPYSAQTVLDAIKKANDSAGRAASMESAFQTAKANAIREEDAVKSIVAGQAERLNWMHLYRFISDAIPRPDGKNLPSRETADLYFNNKPVRAPRAMSGKEAYEEFIRRVRDGFKPLSPLEDKDPDTMPPGVDDLIQFSIEQVDCRFCDDLPTYWKAATTGREQGDVRPLKHYKDKMPEGKGWVVQISGYTYHRGKDGFIRDTLLTNIARLGVAPDDKPAEGAPAAGGEGANAAAGATPPAAGGATPPATTPMPPAAGGATPPAAGGANPPPTAPMPPAAGGANPPAAGGATPAAGGAAPPAAGTAAPPATNPMPPAAGGAAPMPPAAGGAAPMPPAAGGAAVPPAVADAAAPPAEPPKPKEHPVKNRVSHVLLLESYSKATDSTAGFEIIGKSGLDALIGGGSGSGPGEGGSTGGPPSLTGSGGGGSGAAAPSGRGSWANLSSRAGSSGTGGMGGAGSGRSMAGGGLSAAGGTGEGRGGGGGAARPSAPGPGAAGAGGAAGPLLKPGTHQRTEFTILFIWNEPTPSDALRGEGSS